jgi:hypothetical protein
MYRSKVHSRLFPSLAVDACVYRWVGQKGNSKWRWRYIQLIHKVHTIAVATGKYCNNYKAEAAALVNAATALGEHISDTRDKVVIFTDCGNSHKESSPNRPG